MAVKLEKMYEMRETRQAEDSTIIGHAWVDYRKCVNTTKGERFLI